MMCKLENCAKTSDLSKPRILDRAAVLGSKRGFFLTQVKSFFVFIYFHWYR
jgi:hypothetical protein